MGLLYRNRDVSYTRIRDLLDLTDGNLASHAESLEDAGYIETRQAWTQSGFETRYRITQSGVSTFQTYLQELRQFLDEVESE